MKDFPIVSENAVNLKKGEYWFPEYNRLPENTAHLPEKAIIHDVTLRDGEQAPGVTFLEDERVYIAELLDSIGVARIEAGMPAVSDVQYNALKRIAHAGLKAQIFGFGRAHPSDVQKIIDCGCEGIVVEHTVNPAFCKYGYNLTPADLVKRVATSLKTAKEAGLYTVFMGWDWMRAPIELTKWLVGELLNEVDFDGVTIVDTFGTSTPEAVYYMISNFKKWYPNLSLEYHGHNDTGMGVSCSIAALKGGADVIHTAMNCLGERTGNVATEQLLVAGQLLYGLDLGANLKSIYPAAVDISKISKVPIASNQAVIGAREFQIENGVITHMFKQMAEKTDNLPVASLYPSVIGKPGDIEMLLGKNTGKAAVKTILDKYGISATDDQIEVLAAKIKKKGILLKDVVSEEQALAMWKDIVDQK